jgi:hypothetical protein
LKFTRKISKKQWLQLLLFTTVIGLASLLDNYLEKNSLYIPVIQSQDKNTAENQNDLDLIEQFSISINAKITFQKTPERKFPDLSTNKFLPRYHQLRNFQVLKADRNAESDHSGLTCHLPVLRFYRDYLPDEDPHIC